MGNLDAIASLDDDEYDDCLANPDPATTRLRIFAARFYKRRHDKIEKASSSFRKKNKNGF